MPKAAVGIAACLVIAAPLVPREAPAPLVRLAPPSTGRFTHTLSAPPDTASCRIRFGLACYEPAQPRTPYSLHPLLTAGLHRPGRTIAVVATAAPPTLHG